LSRTGLFASLSIALLAIGIGFLVGTRMDGGGPSIPGLDEITQRLGGGSGGDLTCREGGSLMATVGQIPIDRSDIDTELAVQVVLQRKQGLVMPSDEATLRSFRRELLDQLVDQVVLQEAARTAGYSIDGAAVQAEIPTLLERYGLAPDALVEGVRAEGVDDAAYERWAIRQVMNTRYMTQVAPYSSPEDQAARLQDTMELSFCVGGEAVRPATVGLPAPDFELATPEGGSIRLSELRGKAVMVNFWATWCGPCQIEMPLFENAYQTNVDRLTVLGVDVEESAQLVSNYKANNKLSFPMALDEQGEVSLLYRVRGLPTTYFVDAEGIIVDKHRGALISRPDLQPYIDKVLSSDS
jgi:thiol-disulfide isomerase/thioredoxin